MSASKAPASLPSRAVGRLAPSPTGAQHVGNARTYLIAWLRARSRGGRLVLRVEGIDSPRRNAGAGAAAVAGGSRTTSPMAPARAAPPSGRPAPPTTSGGPAPPPRASTRGGVRAAGR